MILFERQTDPIYANSARMQMVYELDTLFYMEKINWSLQFTTLDS